MLCQYPNGVEGQCLPENVCDKERQELTGYNGTWKCPYHHRFPDNTICCPYPGEENLLPGEENALSNSQKPVFATGRASPPGYGRAMGWAWAGCKILEINGLWAGPGWKIWENLFLSHMRFSVENYQLFPAHQHHYQENITKYIKVICFCRFFSNLCLVNP